MAQPNLDYEIKIGISPATKKGGLRAFRLLEPISIGDRDLEKDFRWNGASAWLGRMRFLVASAPHDWDYDQIIAMLVDSDRYNNGKVPREIKARAKRLRKEADQRFRRNVRRYDHQHSIVAWIGYFSVRIGGGIAVWLGCKELKKQRQQGSLKGV